VAAAVPGGHGVLLCPSPVADGATTICSAVPDDGYATAAISGCGGAPSAGDRYLTGAITADCTVTAAFAPDGEDGCGCRTAGGRCAPLLAVALLVLLVYGRRMRPIAFLSILLLASSSAAEGGPVPVGDGHELEVGGELAQMFTSDQSAFDLSIFYGHFVSPRVEVGLAGGVSYRSGGEASASDTGPVGGLAVYALPTSAVVVEGGWSETLAVAARLHPFAAAQFPAFLSPFIAAEVGGLFVEDLDPFLVASLGVGAHLFLTPSVAFTPEVGYGVVWASDDSVHFDGSSHVEHVLALSWGMSVFF
jgi:hypothetical protein